MDTKDFDVVAMRTDLHQIPELGFNETRPVTTSLPN